MFDLPMMLAQAAPTAAPVATGGPLEAIYNLFLNNGLMGAVVALLIYLLIRRDNDLQKSQDGRLSDARVLADIVKEHTSALVASNLAGEERNRALEVAARASEKSAVIIEQLTKEVAELKSNLRSK